MMSETVGGRISSYRLVERVGPGLWKAFPDGPSSEPVLLATPEEPEHKAALRNSSAFRLPPFGGLEKVLERTEEFAAIAWTPGCTLRELLREEGILPPLRAMEILQFILRVLGQLHEIGVPHGGLRPETVFVDKTVVTPPPGDGVPGKKDIRFRVTLGHPALNAFRPSRVPRAEFAYSPLEPPSATLPGQVRRDLYQAGVLLFEMLTGNLPLGLDLPSELNPVAPEQADRIVRKALRADPDQRYASASEMGNDLSAACESVARSLAKRRSNGTEPPPKKTDRRRTRLAPLRSLPGWLLGAAAGILVTSAAWLVSLREKEVPSLPPAGTLEVSSNPPGAEAHLDGALVGLTPLHLFPVTWERHDLRIRTAGHAIRVFSLQPVETSGKRALTVVDRDTGKEFARTGWPLASLPRIDLAKLAGSIRIEVPGVADAAVYLGEKRLGVAPQQMEGLEPALYPIRIEAPGFRPYEGTVRVVAGEKQEVRVLLAIDEAPKEPAEGVIDFRSEPENALLYINGKLHSEKLPSRITLPEGDYEFRVEAPQHAPRELRMRVNRGLETEVFLRLEPATGVLILRSRPAGARVLIDEKVQGETPLRLDAVRVGKHRVRLELQGYRVLEREVEVVETEPAEVEAQLDPRPEPVLVITCPAVGANIYTEDRFLGQTSAGETRISVPPGTKRIWIGGAAFDIQVPEEGEAALRADPDALGLVEIAAGPFWYGAKEEKIPPPNSVRIQQRETKAYWLDRTEVTNARYRDFLTYMKKTQDHSRCHKGEPPGKDHTPDRRYWENVLFNADDQPVVGVDYYDAWAYAAWCGKKLPTEEEWEKGARGKGDVEYPWGDSWRPRALNYDDLGAPAEERDGYQYPAPVGKFEEGRSEWGAYDMAGNVAEWCSDLFQQDSDLRVVRGGSWILDEPNHYRVWWRSSESPSYRGQRVGFRCVLRK